MTQGDGIFAGLAHGERGLRLVGELGFLSDDEIVTHEGGGGEKVDVERLLAVVGIDEVAILGVVLHAGADAAPHTLVGQGVDAVAHGAQGGEVDVAAGLGVLCREDVVPHGLLVEIDVLGIAGAIGQHLRELQHVVGITRLGAVGLVDVAIAVGSGQEVLVDGVAADADGAISGHVLPEVLGGGEVLGG